MNQPHAIHRNVKLSGIQIEELRLAVGGTGWRDITIASWLDRTHIFRYMMTPEA